MCETKKQHCKWVATHATKSCDINRGQEIIYQTPLSCLNDNSLQCILTTMIGFVTWPPYYNNDGIVHQDMYFDKMIFDIL